MAKTAAELAQAARLASSADETPEGRSIVVLVNKQLGDTATATQLTGVTIVPFTAQTRMSGADVQKPDGSTRQLRKGAVDAIRKHVEALLQCPQDVELGGDRAWRKRVIGDIVCAYQWLDIGEDEPTPCMTLFPAKRRMDTAAYVIPQRNAHAYAANNGHASGDLMGLAFMAAEHMGFFPDKSTVSRIMNIVLEGIPDLIDMPSDQHADLGIKRPLQGIEATVTLNGRI